MTRLDLTALTRKIYEEVFIAETRLYWMIIMPMTLSSTGLLTQI
jgi:hypothetical protein